MLPGADRERDPPALPTPTAPLRAFTVEGLLGLSAWRRERLTLTAAPESEGVDEEVRVDAEEVESRRAAMPVLPTPTLPTLPTPAAMPVKALATVPRVLRPFIPAPVAPLTVV